MRNNITTMIHKLNNNSAFTIIKTLFNKILIMLQLKTSLKRESFLIIKIAIQIKVIIIQIIIFIKLVQIIILTTIVVLIMITLYQTTKWTWNLLINLTITFYIMEEQLITVITLTWWTVTVNHFIQAAVVALSKKTTTTIKV